MATITAPQPSTSASPAAAGSVPIVRIEPPSGWLELRLDEVWEYRELLYFFTWRDIKIRYKQTVVGVVWVVLQPLMTMGVFTDRKSTRLNSSHLVISYAVFCLKKKKKYHTLHCQ